MQESIEIRSMYPEFYKMIYNYIICDDYNVNDFKEMHQDLKDELVSVFIPEWLSHGYDGYIDILVCEEVIKSILSGNFETTFKNKVFDQFVIKIIGDVINSFMVPDIDL